MGPSVPPRLDQLYVGLQILLTRGGGVCLSEVGRQQASADDQPKAQRARRQGKHGRDYSQVREEALRLLASQPAVEALQAAINFQQIRQQLLRTARGDWTQKKSVNTTVKTAADRAQSDLEPQEWMALDLMAAVELVNLRLRTAPSAMLPIRNLLNDVEEQRYEWPDGIADAARQVFLNALVMRDDESVMGPSRGAAVAAQSESWIGPTYLRRVDVLRIRSLESAEKSPIKTWKRYADIHRPVSEYNRLWRNLIRSYGRGLKPGMSIGQILDQLGALEDGFVAIATGMDVKVQQSYADSFAHGVQAILDMSTVRLTVSE